MIRVSVIDPLRFGAWLLVACATASCAQAPPPAEGTSVASPERANATATELPASIARALGTDEHVLDCAQGTRDGVSRFQPDWVDTRRADLNDDGRIDWIVRGRHDCLRDDEYAYWWAYVDEPAGQRLVLPAAVANDLRTADTSTNGFRDLRLQLGDGEEVAHYDGDVYALPASEPAPTPASATGIDTVAGRLEIAELPRADGGQEAFRITLAGRELRRTGGGGDFPDFPAPRILQRYERGIAPFDETIVFQQDMRGNACDGGPLWILGLRRDGGHAISKPIDFCGGKAPQLSATREQLTIVLPGGPLNRGEGEVPIETWRYRDGEIVRVPAP